MPALKAEIVRVADESQPGWVECRFRDIAGVEHVLIEKIPVVTRQQVTPEAHFPVPIFIECVVRGMSSDGSLVNVDLEIPWGLEADSGLTQFGVRADQVMPCVFVSCADIDAYDPQCLLASLRTAECVVDHSPTPPDDRWSTWYERGLLHALARADAFVIVIDEAWDSSTWMGEEARQALEASGIRNAFFWNPNILPVRAMHFYLGTRLPENSEAAARIIRNVRPRVV